MSLKWNGFKIGILLVAREELSLSTNILKLVWERQWNWKPFLVVGENGGLSVSNSMACSLLVAHLFLDTSEYNDVNKA